MYRLERTLIYLLTGPYKVATAATVGKYEASPSLNFVPSYPALPYSIATNSISFRYRIVPLDCSIIHHSHISLQDAPLVQW